jgi:hypothetical protein
MEHYWKYYWSVVGVLIVVKIGLKFFVPGLSEEMLFLLVVAYVFLASVPFMVIGGTQGFRLQQYVQKHYDRRVLPLINTPTNNRLLHSVLRSESGLSDPVLVVLNARSKELFLLTSVAFIMSVPLSFLFVAW